MIHIAILILKIIGLILLAVLGILFLLLLLILLVPVRYSGAASYAGAPRADVRVAWLFSLVSLEVRSRKRLKWRLRLFGRRIAGSRRAAQEIKQSPAPASPEAPPEAETALAGDILSPEAETALTGDILSPEEERELEEELGREIREGRERRLARDGRGEEQRSPAAPGKSIAHRLREIAEKVMGFIRDIRDGASEASEKFSRILEEIEGEENRRTARLLLRQAVRILRHILPGKADGRVDFGFDDPAATGRVLAALAFVWPAFGGGLEIVPEFTRKTFQANARFAGRVRLGTLLILAGRMFLDRNFRHWFRKIIGG